MPLHDCMQAIVVGRIMVVRDLAVPLLSTVMHDHRHPEPQADLLRVHSMARELELGETIV